ncbi:MFS transporter [Fundidesulfovibrio butyratiphilus]
MKSTTHNRWKLPEAVVKLGWISFFTDVASEMIYPVVPLFLTSALGAPVAILGLIEGIAEAIVCVMKGVSGWSSDRLGRRVPYIRWGYGMAAVSKPLLALAFSWPMVFFARSLDRLGKGLRTTARDALIADAVDSSHGGKAYGFHRMLDTSGAVIGVLIATGLLALLPGQYRTIFLIAALPGLLAVRLAFKLRDVSSPTPVQAAAPPSRPGSSLGEKPWSGLPKAFWVTLGLLLLFAFANSSDTLLILRAKNLGLSDVQCILAYTLFNLLYALSAYPLGALSDRMGRWPMVIGGWSLYAAVYFGFAFADKAGVWWLFPLYGLYMGLTDGVGRALIRDKIPEEKKGTAMGIFQMSLGFTALAGSVVAGLLWDAFGPQAPFLLDATVAAAAVAMALLVIPKIKTA